MVLLENLTREYGRRVISNLPDGYFMGVRIIGSLYAGRKLKPAESHGTPHIYVDGDAYKRGSWMLHRPKDPHELTGNQYKRMLSLLD